MPLAVRSNINFSYFSFNISQTFINSFQQFHESIHDKHLLAYIVMDNQNRVFCASHS